MNETARACLISPLIAVEKRSSGPGIENGYTSHSGGQFLPNLGVGKKATIHSHSLRDSCPSGSMASPRIFTVVGNWHAGVSEGEVERLSYTLRTGPLNPNTGEFILFKIL